MKLLNNLSQAVPAGWEYLLNCGRKVEAKNWQGLQVPYVMFEATDFCFRAPMPNHNFEADMMLKPNTEWANAHFMERVGGEALNPPPSNEIWPFAADSNSQFKKDGKFDHTYPERFWPKKANRSSGELKNKGIRFNLGDLLDLTNKLIKDPLTRQAYLPIWFPEDTGKPDSVRVPCTLGYHFMIRENRLDIKYIMRSTDMLRHYQDDLYMCYLLAEHVFEQLVGRSDDHPTHLGFMTFMTFSAHVFEQEQTILKQKINVWNNQIKK